MPQTPFLPLIINPLSDQLPQITKLYNRDVEELDTTMIGWLLKSIIVLNISPTLHIHACFSFVHQFYPRLHSYDT